MIRTFHNYETHQPVLIEVLKRTTGAVLELGAGDYSTILIHEYSKDRKVLTVDDSQKWLNKYISLRTINHEFICVRDERFQGFYDNDNEQWSVVFIDNGIWNARMKAIIKYKNIADYLILHDCDYMPRNRLLGTTTNGKYRNYDSMFRFWNEYFIDGSPPGNPPTLLASNKVSVRDIVVDGMFVANASKL